MSEILLLRSTYDIHFVDVSLLYSTILPPVSSFLMTLSSWSPCPNVFHVERIDPAGPIRLQWAVPQNHLRHLGSCVFYYVGPALEMP